MDSQKKHEDSRRKNQNESGFPDRLDFRETAGRRWWALRDSNPEPRDYEHGPKPIEEHLDIDVSSRVNWHLLSGAHGILTGMSEFNADAATLKLLCHRVSAGLTEEILVAVNLVIHSPGTMVSDWRATTGSTLSAKI